MLEGDSIDRLVYRALRGNELLVASPSTIQKAIERGEPFKEQPRLSAEEAINKLFDERKQHALKMASKLLPCPIPETPILYLYDQIRLCILFNMNGAAITFCGILLEYTLKYATYRQENHSNPNFDSEAWQRFEELTLVPAIVRARKAGLIDDDIEKRLRAFAKELRNRYSHFNIQKITENAVFGNVKDRNLETGEERVVELRASFSPTLQIIAKEKLDEMTVLNVFQFVDSAVSHLFAKVRENAT